MTTNANAPRIIWIEADCPLGSWYPPELALEHNKQNASSATKYILHSEYEALNKDYNESVDEVQVLYSGNVALQQQLEVLTADLDKANKSLDLKTRIIDFAENALSMGFSWNSYAERRNSAIQQSKG